jgi:ribosome-binding protein aMBF1 (putative translation factor)
MGLLSFQDHLNEELKDPEFKAMFDEETRLLELGIRIAEERQKRGISQKELAAKSRVTQQQLSKVENGVNCNIRTFIKISNALGMPLVMKSA